MGNSPKPADQDLNRRVASFSHSVTPPTCQRPTRRATGGACPWVGAGNVYSWHFMVAKQLFPKNKSLHLPERLPVTPKACRIRWRTFCATEGQALPGGNKLPLFRACPYPPANCLCHAKAAPDPPLGSGAAIHCRRSAHSRADEGAGVNDLAFRSMRDYV